MFMFLLSLFASTASASFEVPGFELVVTTPVETKLPNDDLRGTTEVWGEMIDGAKSRIDLGQMYASGKKGEPLDIIFTKLEAAAERGVKIRMILEAAMERASDPETLARLKAIKGLELRVIKFGDVSEGGITHAKYISVDNGETTFIGSQNFDWRALKHIHETGLRIVDKKISAQIQAIFDQDWKAADLLAKGKKVPVLNKASVPAETNARAYLVASPNAFNPKGIPDSQAELPRLIGEAKEEVRVLVMDYYPLNRDKTFYPVIDNALRAAAARGVKVKLLIANWSTEKPGIDHIKSLALLPGIEVRITTIPAAKEGFIPFARVTHSKIMDIDGKTGWVGTSNWTGGYLDKTRNIEIVIRDDKFAQRLAALHEQLWASPYSAPIEINKEYPKVNQAGESK